jgi:hypothetical protein
LTDRPLTCLALCKVNHNDTMVEQFSMNTFIHLIIDSQMEVSCSQKGVGYGLQYDECVVLGAVVFWNLKPCQFDMCVCVHAIVLQNWYCTK